MASATALDAATALTTFLEPVTTSPAEKTPSTVVMPFSSVVRRPVSVHSRPGVVSRSLFLGPWLMAMMVESACTWSSSSSQPTMLPSSSRMLVRKSGPSSVILTTSLQ